MTEGNEQYMHSITETNSYVHFVNLLKTISRHYYRIKQQHLKLYFERYCLERGVVATVATQGDPEEEEYSALPSYKEMSTFISTSSKEKDEEYWEGKKKPNYMLDVSNVFV